MAAVLPAIAERPSAATPTPSALSSASSSSSMSIPADPAALPTTAAAAPSTTSKRRSILMLRKRRSVAAGSVVSSSSSSSSYLPDSSAVVDAAASDPPLRSNNSSVSSDGTAVSSAGSPSPSPDLQEPVAADADPAPSTTTKFGGPLSQLFDRQRRRSRMLRRGSDALAGVGGRPATLLAEGAAGLTEEPEAEAEAAAAPRTAEHMFFKQREVSTTAIKSLHEKIKTLEAERDGLTKKVRVVVYARKNDLISVGFDPYT
ncbi:hypothetical protein HK405_014750 [Cladochytrium tenue]|nr:hypothetical protein HK405_014750 [Cladochytrium tenue]